MAAGGCQLLRDLQPPHPTQMVLRTAAAVPWTRTWASAAPVWLLSLELGGAMGRCMGQQARVVLPLGFPPPLVQPPAALDLLAVWHAPCVARPPSCCLQPRCAAPVRALARAWRAVQCSLEGNY